MLLRRFLAFLGVCTLFFIVAQSTILPGVVEQLLHRSMSEAGFPVQSLEIRSVSWSHAVFSSVVLGKHKEITIDTLHLDYDLRSMLHGRVLAVQLSGALLTSPWNSEHLSHAASRFLPPDALSVFPFEKLTISSSSLLFIRDDARLRIPFEASIQRKQEHLTLSLDTELLGGQTTLSVTTSLQGAPQRVYATMRGLNPGLMPRPFLPALFSIPLQGALNGSAQAILNNNNWQVMADLNFSLSGEIQRIPFSIQPTRMEFNATLNPRGTPENIRIDLACAEAQLIRWNVHNLSASVTGDTQTLTAQLTGTGNTWDAKEATARFTGYIDWLKQRLLHRPAQEILPHFYLSVNEFNHRYTVARLYLENATFEADLAAGTSVPHFSNARLSLKNGRLTSKNMLIDGINTTLQLEELFPLTTHDMQQATISQAVFGGITLTDGNILYEVESPESLLIERCEWSWCDGRITSRSFSLPFKAPEVKCTAFFENISLARLTQLLLPGKMEGTGHLFGRLPINLRLAPECALTFGKGHLYTVPSFGTASISDEGIIRETLIGPESDAKAPGDTPRNKLVQQALRDYRFNMLKVNFDRIRENGLSGFIQLRGNGPPPNELSLGLTIPFAIE